MAEAGFAAAALVVEGEAAVRVAAHAGSGEAGEEFPDFVEDLHISGGRGAGGFADRRLVDFEDAGEVFESADAGVEVGVERSAFAGEGVADGGDDDAADECGFAGAGNAGEDGEAVEGNADGFVLDVVEAAAFEFEPLVGSGAT